MQIQFDYKKVQCREKEWKDCRKELLYTRSMVQEIASQLMRMPEYQTMDRQFQKAEETLEQAADSCRLLGDVLGECVRHYCGTEEYLSERRDLVRLFGRAIWVDLGDLDVRLYAGSWKNLNLPVRRDTSAGQSGDEWDSDEGER